MSLPTPDVSVIICSYNGARKIGNTLDGVNRQSCRDRVEVIVVDDGSTDETAEIAGSYGARVIVHDVNRGLAAARNTGVCAAAAPIVAFTDDDAIPTASWLEDLLEVYTAPDIVAVGGAVHPAATTSFIQRYLAANNPLAPLEAELEASSKIAYRAWLYIRRNLLLPTDRGMRSVYALPGVNLSVRREALIAVGMFDARIRFAGEDEDACRRLRAAFPDCRMVFTPTAAVAHDFDPGLRDTLRRSQAYGQGSGRNFATGAADHPTVYPWPAVVALLIAAGAVRRPLLGLAVLCPAIAFPRWLIEAGRRRCPEYVLFSWVQLLQEAATDVGFVLGWLQARSAAKAWLNKGAATCTTAWRGGGSFEIRTCQRGDAT